MPFYNWKVTNIITHIIPLNFSIVVGTAVPSVPSESFLLEKVFICVSLIVIILLVYLISLLLRSKYARKRFKLLDNSGKKYNRIEFGMIYNECFSLQKFKNGRNRGVIRKLYRGIKFFFRGGGSATVVP